jgi:hypothetical protein
VAFAALGVALAGLAPLVVTQLRLMSRIEARLPDGAALYLVPAADPWARKLGVAATLAAADPGGTAGDPSPAPRNRVRVVAAEVAGPADVASVEALVEPIPREPDAPPTAPEP